MNFQNVQELGFLGFLKVLESLTKKDHFEIICLTRLAHVFILLSRVLITIDVQFNQS